MFHFAMDIKDALAVSPEKLKQHGVQENIEFQKQFIEDFQNTHPKFNEEETDDYYAIQVIYHRIVFTSEQSPKDFDEAAQIVMKVFFFPPEIVWIDGVQYNRDSDELNVY